MLPELCSGGGTKGALVVELEGRAALATGGLLIGAGVVEGGACG